MLTKWNLANSRTILETEGFLTWIFDLLFEKQIRIIENTLKSS